MPKVSQKPKKSLQTFDLEIQNSESHPSSLFKDPLPTLKMNTQLSRQKEEELKYEIFDKSKMVSQGQGATPIVEAQTQPIETIHENFENLNLG